MAKKKEKVVEKTTDEVTKVDMSSSQGDPGDENIVKVDLNNPPTPKEEVVEDKTDEAVTEVTETKEPESE